MTGLGARAGLDRDLEPALGQALDGVGDERHATLPLG